MEKSKYSAKPTEWVVIDIVEPNGRKYHFEGVYKQCIFLLQQAAEQSVQTDGVCTCANRHIGEDHICVNCGGVV